MEWFLSIPYWWFILIGVAVTCILGGILLDKLTAYRIKQALAEEEAEKGKVKPVPVPRHSEREVNNAGRDVSN